MEQVAFCHLLAKIFPLQVTMNAERENLRVIERVIVDSAGQEIILSRRQPMKSVVDT
jgi:hypothetical protein